MQDGAPIHRSKSTRRWLRLKKVQMFYDDYWPPQSPDLNPIENVWALCVQAMQGQLYNSRAELYAAAQKAFHDIPDQAIVHLYDSIPRRLSAVIDVHGGHTKY
jgi:transposase